MFGTLARERSQAVVRHVKQVTTHQAKTHLLRLLKEVQAGETVVILSGSTPVARLSAAQPATASQPPVGTLTSQEVGYSEDAFRPLTDEDLKAWGL